MATDNLSWTISLGGLANIWGSVNMVLADNPVEAMITSRYGSGNGGPMEGVGNWLDTYGDKLVVYAGANDAAGAGETGTVAAFYSSNPAAPAHDPYLENAGYITVLPSSMLVVPGVIWSASNINGAYPYIALVFDGTNTVIGLIKDDAGNIYSFAGGDTVITNGWHVIGIGYDGANIFVTTDASVETTEIAVSSGVMTNLEVSTIGAIKVNNQYGNFYGNTTNLNIGRIVIYDTETLSGNRLSSADRSEIFATLKRTYTLLP